MQIRINHKEQKLNGINNNEHIKFNFIYKDYSYSRKRIGKTGQKNKELDPKTTNLIEGTDIDARFATLLRTDSTVQSQGNNWSGFGKDKDQLTIADMSSLTKITVTNKNLDSLKGIKYAEQLTDLSCQFNNLTNLDFSQNRMLETLSCSGNRLTDLDITQNTYLRNLDCSSNQLTTLDVSQNTRLHLLDCSYNQLTVLDVTNNVDLAILVCLSNQLTVLDVSSQNTNLFSIDCSYNELSDITNLNNLTNLQTFDASEQTISIPVPTISNSNQASVDILKTTAHRINPKQHKYRSFTQFFDEWGSNNVI